MTKVLLFRSAEGRACGFSVSGHSGLAPEGSDILCAAISSMSQLVINTLTEDFSAEAEITVNERKAELSVKLVRVPKEYEAAAEGLLHGYLRELQTLREAYPKHLSLGEKQA